jgi:hypothetical protein
MDGERSSHVVHDNSSPTDGGSTAGNRPPLRVMSRSPRRAPGASSCYVACRRARGSATVKQASRQSGRYRGSATLATMTRAHPLG